MATHIRDQFARHRSAPISTSARPDEIRRHLQSTFDFSAPMSPDLVFSETAEMLWRWAEHATNPMHFGLTRPTVDVVSVIADALVALYDPNLAMWEFAPAAIEIENRMAIWDIGAALGEEKSPWRIREDLTTPKMPRCLDPMSDDSREPPHRQVSWDDAGLRLEALYGGFAGEPFTDDSREYVFVARRERQSGG